MVDGFFYNRKIPKKDSIVIGKVLKNIENLRIEIFLLEYNLLAFIKFKDLNENINILYEGNILTFLVIGKKNNKIQLSNKYIQLNNKYNEFYNKYQKIVYCLLKISKIKNITYNNLAKRTIWNNSPESNLFFFYLIKTNKLNIVDNDYDIDNSIIKLIQKYYNPLNKVCKIQIKLIVKNEYNYPNIISALKKKIESLGFISFNINNTPVYNIIYDCNFWYNMKFLLKLITKIFELYNNYLIKYEIIDIKN